MKKILGLDLGTTSIGWAFVNEAETENEKSSIERIGVRVNPLSVDERTNFEKGKPISINADRTLKRGARRTLDRYQLRRKNLIEILLENAFITDDTIFAENAKNTTHSTYALRAKAAKDKITLEEFARVLLMINKKRGYKSSRKAKNEEEGQTIDGMTVAKRLNEEKLTPGQLCLQLLNNGKKDLPDFYRSDLNMELDAVWEFQKKYYPEILTEQFRKVIEGKGQRATSAIFWTIYNFNTAENKEKDKKKQAYMWRSDALAKQLTKEEVAYVIVEINTNLYNASGYLGAISDRSKELFFKKQTVGEFLFNQLQHNPHFRTKGQVFYRQDYLDEFDTIWENQSKFHKALNKSLKNEIRDLIIFYQRKLKSQKGLISYCEFEFKQLETIEEGVPKTITVGSKVAPKSSPLFQEFKIWQNLNNLRIQNKKTKEVCEFDLDAKKLVFNELNLKGNLKKAMVLNLLGYNTNEWDLNFSSLEGNRTNSSLIDAYLKILEIEGYDIKDILKVKSDKDNFDLSEIETKSSAIKEMLQTVFRALNIDIAILDFNSDLMGKEFEKQQSYKLWHLLYSYEGDNSNSGNDLLYRLLESKFGFKREHCQMLANINFQLDYGSLSSKAIRKILPYLKEGHPFAKNDINENKISATALAGYNHSSSITKAENEQRTLKDKLELLAKNSLRSPVVEKILNQMINVVNAIIADPDLGKPDEIRIELARELKKNAKEREEMTVGINRANEEHSKIIAILIKEDGIKNPTRNDIIRYKLYRELEINGYKTLYSNTYIPRQKLFSKEFDIEHIIPKAKLFDDSFSNKTIESRDVNLKKGDSTAYDFVLNNLGETGLAGYIERIEMLYKAKEVAISKAKYKKLLLKSIEIGEGFIERDLRETQYIAKKAKEMLQEICRTVVSTSGSITQRLREDWDLVNVMQELNLEKYRKLGLTEMIEKKDGGTKERIIDWTKRNDHRHHAMDALTIAFTKHSHIQYLNNLSARKYENKRGKEIYGIEQKETEIKVDNNGNKKRKFKLPIPNFRNDAKKHLEEVLISFKAKNKISTKNKNKTKTKTGINTKIELTPRGQLHKETVYGSRKIPVYKLEKIGPKLDINRIKLIENKNIRKAIETRLAENDNDPKKAFTGANNLDKKPIFLNAEMTVQVPQEVQLKWYENEYTIRKEVNPDNFKDYKNIEKIVDLKVRGLLSERLKSFNGNAKEAFSNLDKNPIWLNQERGIEIKRITITGVSNAEPLHTKNDHLGRPILDKNGNKIPVDFVSTGNNHHVAIYSDDKGNLQEKVVSLFEAIQRVNQELPVIDKAYNNEIGWHFLFTMKQNEYFVFPSNDFDPNEIDLKNPNNCKIISPNLYRVQKLATKNYMFRHHLETSVKENKLLVSVAYFNIQNTSPLFNLVKVRINHIGQIIHVGEY